MLALVLTACGRALAPTEEACGSCHQTLAENFATSRHASAARGPVFVAMRAKVGAEHHASCDACHLAEHGVGCLTCHGAVGNEQTMNGLLRSAGDHPRIGASQGAPSAPHEVEARPFLASSELCGTCHEVQGPAAFQETPYREWSMAGEVRTCGTCHLADHRFGLRALLTGAVKLGVTRVDAQTVQVQATSLVSGHNFPSGARFAHEAWVEVRGGDGSVLRLELSELLSGPNPFEAVRLANHSLAPTEVRAWVVPATAEPVVARVLYRRYRRELLEWLELDSQLGETVEVARAVEGE